MHPRSHCRGRCPHRPATGWNISMTRLDGEMLRFHPISPPRSTRRSGFVGFRDDVGIVPYIRVEPCAVRRTGSQVKHGTGQMNGMRQRFHCRGRCPHRPATGAVYFHGRLNGEMLLSSHFSAPFNVPRGFVGFAGRCGHRPLHSCRTVCRSSYLSSISGENIFMRRT